MRKTALSPALHVCLPASLLFACLLLYAQGLLKAREVMAQPALSERAYESYPHTRVTDYKTFKELLIHGGMFRKGSHYFGGCTLGDVVDHKLRVKGLVSGAL